MSRRLLTLLSVVVIAVAMLSPVGGAGAAESDLAFGGAQKHQVQESTTGSYVVIMAAAPLVGTYDRSELNSAGARADRARITESHRQVMRDAGVSETDKVVELTNVVNGFSAIISHEEAQALAAQPGVALVMPDVMRQPTTDSSPDFLGLTAPGGAYDTGLDGSGVVVGVIDTGIWPEHPSFADDGSFPEADVAPGIPCEFGNTAHNPADAPFECNNKLVGARQVLPTYRALIGAEDFEFDSARDDNGHGSHTASTAAGNADVAATVFGRPRGTVNGIAYRAHVIAYKGLGALGGFSSDLALAIDTAVADGVDVINYSIGGGASLTGPDDLAFLFAADAGVFVATSAGNSGNGFSTIGGPANLPWVTTVAASTQSRFFPGRVVLGNGQSFLGASITRPLGNRPLVDAADAGGDLCLLGTLDPAVVEGAIVLCRRGTNARVEKSQAVLEAGGVGMIMYENTDDNNLFTDNHAVPTVHVDNTPGLAIKDYIANTANPTARLRVPLTTTTWGPAPSITLFSSRGPVPTGFGEDIIKPDITAPGIQILAGNSPVRRQWSAVPGDRRDLDVEPAHRRGLRPAQAGASRLVAGGRPLGPDDHGAPRRGGQRPGHPGRPVRHRLGSRQPWPPGRGGLDVPARTGVRRRVQRLPRIPVRHRTRGVRRPGCHLPGARGGRLLQRPEQPQLPVDRRRPARRLADGHPHGDQRRAPCHLPVVGRCAGGLRRDGDSRGSSR